MEIPLIRKAAAAKGKFIWTDEMKREYVTVRQTILEQIIGLTPFDERERLRLIVDGASKEGVGFVLFQW